MVVLEAVLVSLLLLGAAYYVMNFRAPSSATDPSRHDLELVASDALTILAGLGPCDDLSGSAATDCLNAYQTALDRFAVEAMYGNATNLTDKLKGYLPPGAVTNTFLANGAGTRDVWRVSSTSGERVSATVPYTPGWHRAFLVPDLAATNWSATGYDNLTVNALALVREQAVDPGRGALTASFPADGRTLSFTNATDADRGLLSTLAYFRFDEGSGTTTADQTGRFNITVNSTHWTQGVHGSGYDFQGGALDNNLSLPLADARLATSAATVEAWVRLDTIPAKEVQVIKLKNGATSLALRIHGSGTGQLVASYRSPGSLVNVTSATLIKRGSWTHLAATLDGSTLTLYVNGTAENKTATSGGLSGTGNGELFIGGKGSGDTTTMDGRIDDARVYGRALGADEFSHMQVGSLPPDRAGAPGWSHGAALQHVKTSSTVAGKVVADDVTYREVADPSWGTKTATLRAGLNQSRLAVWENGTYHRVVRVGNTLVVNADFSALLAKLASAGVRFAAGSVNYTTITVAAPVVGPPGAHDARVEVFNRTVEWGKNGSASNGFVNFTLPRESFLGSNLVVASLNMTFDESGTRVHERARLVDYFDATLPGMTSAPADPFYDLGIETWFPDWG